MRAIKRNLERKRLALATAIQTGMVSARNLDERRELFKDPYGSASRTHDEEITVTVVERLARELDEVNRALEEIDAGRYGQCRDCGEGIAPARLRVMPFATRCVTCQAEFEQIRRAA